MLTEENKKYSYSHLKSFHDCIRNIDIKNYENQLLPNLLFHLLIYEKPEIDELQHPLAIKTEFNSTEKSEWGLGPQEYSNQIHKAWYQPFRHDIIGDTLSADLIDYLIRDQSRLGMKNNLDLKLLNYYILVPVPLKLTDTVDNPNQVYYRCAIDLNDHKRGTFRAERLNDIFRLLDLRHQIHEKAVYHRVVLSAVAMLSRAGLILDLSNMKPDLKVIYGLHQESPALSGDEHFIQLLIRASNDKRDEEGIGGELRFKSLPLKLVERRVYRPLMVIPGDRINILLKDLMNIESGLEHTLRELAAIVDSPYYSSFFLLISTCIEKLLQHAIDSDSAFYEVIKEVAIDKKRLAKASKNVPMRVIFWTTPYKQLYKDPAILVCVDKEITGTIEELRKEEIKITENLKSRIKAGLSDAETKNEGLWKIYVFISDGLFYTGILAKILDDHPCGKSKEKHKEHLKMAQNIIVNALRCAWRDWEGRGKNKRIDLNKHMEVDQLSELLSLFVNDENWFRKILETDDITKAVSAVNVDNYLHGDDLANCRDIRYKYDKSDAYESYLNKLFTKEQSKIIKEFIRVMGISTKSIMAEEMLDLLTILKESISDLPDIVEAKAARNKPFDETKLKKLWLKEI